MQDVSRRVLICFARVDLNAVWHSKLRIVGVTGHGEAFVCRVVLCRPAHRHEVKWTQRSGARPPISREEVSLDLMYQGRQRPLCDGYVSNVHTITVQYHEQADCGKPRLVAVRNERLYVLLDAGGA